MSLEEKIKARLNILAIESSGISEETYMLDKVFETDSFAFDNPYELSYSEQRDILDWRQECVSRCIQELKQLLN